MAGHKILVIDGDLKSRNFVAHILRLLGHTVLSAASGNEGLTAAWRDSPELIIADPLLSDVPGEELANRLRADARTASIPLIALSHNARTARLRSWLDSGFDDYLVKSPELVPLLQASIAELLGGTRRARKGGILIVFFGAKGGVGTSSLCVNLASCMSANTPQGRVAVADLVLPMGSLSEIVDYHGKDDLDSMAQKYSRGSTRNLLRDHVPLIQYWRFYLLAGCTDPEQARRLNFTSVGKVIQGLKTLYDYVVVDVGRTLSRITLPLILDADLVAITTSSDPDAVRLTRSAWDYLQARGLAAASAYLILNRPLQTQGLGKAEVEQAIGLPARALIPFLRENLALANLWHRPYDVKFPDDSASLTLNSTARELIDVANRQRKAA